MFENTVIMEKLSEDIMQDSERFGRVYTQFINALSENQFTISQTRHLFNSILNQFEREMPVTNHVGRH